MIEPYCPHLGAHIGVGGKVDGNLIRCPFHAWGFDKDGFCKNIPYVRKVPFVYNQKPLMKSIPLIECNKIIWAWYHPGLIEPIWSIDEIQEVNDLEWTDFEKFEFEVNTSIQDIAENSVDYAHFKYVHGHSSNLAGETTQNGIYRCVRILGNIYLNNTKNEAVQCDYSIEVLQKGPGYQVIRYRREVDLLLLFIMSPITSDKTMLRLAFTHQKYKRNSIKLNAVKNLMAEKLGTHGKLTGIHADLSIWNNKIYRERPLLCDGDGPILQFREWFKQFYAGSKPSGEA